MLHATAVAVLWKVHWVHRAFCDAKWNSCAPNVKLKSSLPHLEWSCSCVVCFYSVMWRIDIYIKGSFTLYWAPRKCRIQLVLQSFQTRELYMPLVLCVCVLMELKILFYTSCLFLFYIFSLTELCIHAAKCEKFKAACDSASAHACSLLCIFKHSSHLK